MSGTGRFLYSRFRFLTKTKRTIVEPIKRGRERLRRYVAVVSLDDSIKQKENVWTIPNALCGFRIGAAPVLTYLVLNNQLGPATGVFIIAGVTDLIDGWIARVVPGQSSYMGTYLDPLADKILVGSLFISLTYIGLIPVPLTGLIIARDAILIASGFYIRYRSLEPPRTWSRYWDVTMPTAHIKPTFVSKVNTGMQLGLIASTLVSTIVPYEMSSFLQVLWVSTAATTFASGLNYLYAKGTVKFLRNIRKYRRNRRTKSAP